MQPAPPGVQPAVRGTLPVLPALHSQLFTQPLGISAARSPAGLAAYLAARSTSSSAVSRTLKGNKECQLQRFFCNIILEARTKLLFPGTKLPACTTSSVTGSSALTDEHTSRPWQLVRSHAQPFLHGLCARPFVRPSSIFENAVYRNIFRAL